MIMKIRPNTEVEIKEEKKKGLCAHKMNAHEQKKWMTRKEKMGIEKLTFHYIALYSSE